MKISKVGLDLIKEFEGLHKLLPDGRVAAYRDPVGIPTIGWGTTYYGNGKRVQMGDVRTVEECEAYLLAQIENIYASAVNRYVQVSISQNMFDALTSFTYNVGTNGLKTSSALRHVNAGRWKEAAEALKLWNKGTINGKLVVLPGLVRRRQAEADLFLKGSDGASTAPRYDDSIDIDKVTWLSLVRKEEESEVSYDVYGMDSQGNAIAYHDWDTSIEQLQEIAAMYPNARTAPIAPTNWHPGTLPPKLDIEDPADTTLIDKVKGNGVFVKRTGKSDPQRHDLELLEMTIVARDSIVGTFFVNSGAPGKQRFLEVNQAPAGSGYPCPAGEYVLGKPVTGNWGIDGIGLWWISMTNSKENRRSAFGIHNDENRSYSPGTAGCIGARTASDMDRIAKLIQQWGLTHMVCDWS